MGENGSPFTPRSTGRRRTATPYSSSPTVTTPEQLRQYLEAFEEQAQASPGQSAATALYRGQQPFGAIEQVGNFLACVLRHTDAVRRVKKQPGGQRASAARMARGASPKSFAFH